MRRRRFTLLDVFTSQRLTGNGLAVVHDADDLDAGVMQRLAREMRLSETSFVAAPQAGGDYRHRIFMPTHEIPFAGHPSLGAAVAVARVRGTGSRTFVQETQAGQQPIDVELRGDVARASMLQEPVRLGDEPDPEEVLRAVGLTAADADPDLPVRYVSTGAWQLLAPVRDPAALGRLVPDHDAIHRLLAPLDAIVLYVAHVDGRTGRAAARSFAGSVEVGEDPATGAAAGPLCAYVFERIGCRRLEVVQGVKMGRRSVLSTEVEGDRVRVAGDVVVVVEGEILLDA